MFPSPSTLIRHDQDPEAVCSVLDVFPRCFLSESIDAVLSPPPHLIFSYRFGRLFPLTHKHPVVNPRYHP